MPLIFNLSTQWGGGGGRERRRRDKRRRKRRREEEEEEKEGGGGRGEKDNQLSLPPSPLVPTDDNTQTERGEKTNAHLLSSRCGP